MIVSFARFSLFLAVFTCAGLASAQNQGPERIQIATSNGQRDALMWSPEREGAPRPAAVLLHGFTGSALGIVQTSGFLGASRREGWALVAPEGLGRPAGWNAGFVNLGRTGVDDIGFLGALLDRLATTPGIDPKRMYLIGHSNGAMLAAAMLSKRPDRIAGVVGVGGLIGVGRDSRLRLMDPPRTPVSTLFIHGTADNVVGYTSEGSALLVGMGVEDGAGWLARQMGLPLSPRVRERGPERRLTYQNGRTEVEVLSLKGWGHDWPRRPAAPVDATEVAIQFLRTESAR